MTEVIVLQHIDCEPLGTIEDALRDAALGFRVVRGYAGETVPQETGDAPGLIVMGGPMGVYQGGQYPFLTDEMRLIENAVANGIPTLGVCLGSQLLATVLGASVRPGAQPEIGWYPVTRTPQGGNDALWSILPAPFIGFHWHGDVFDAPPGTQTLASSEMTPCQAFRYGPSTYGVLTHMEITEGMVREWVTAFAGEVQSAGLDPATLLAGISEHLPAVQKAGQAFFGGWAANVAYASSCSR